MTELKPIAAIEQLTMHQQQLDMDGVFVGVSRQALDELLAYVTRADGWIAKIADGLSAKQREAVLGASDMMSHYGGYAFLTVRHTGEPWPMGIAEFLTLKSDRLTPLGLAVREYLRSKNDV